MNKLFLAVAPAVFLGAGCAGEPPAPAPHSSMIGYPDVASVRTMLAGRSDVHRYTLPSGWTIVEVPSEQIVWAFVPDNSPMAPAVVKKQTEKRADRIVTNVTSRCEGQREACDGLMQEYAAIAPRMEQRPRATDAPETEPRGY
jgi:hypothetical protein